MLEDGAVAGAEGAPRSASAGQRDARGGKKFAETTLLRFLSKEMLCLETGNKPLPGISFMLFLFKFLHLVGGLETSGVNRLCKINRM